MIHEVSLNDCLEPTAPPSRVLNISALDDTAFVRICDVQQDARSETHTEVADISVSLASLLQAVWILASDAEREQLRPLDNTGKEHETRLAGRRVTFTGTGPGSAVMVLQDHSRYTPPPRKQQAGGDGEATP